MRNTKKQTVSVNVNTLAKIKVLNDKGINISQKFREMIDELYSKINVNNA